MTENEERRRIACLQTMLRAVAGVYPKLKKPGVTGRMDEGTLEALMLFQRELCPPVTGRADGRTWEELERLYRRVEGEKAGELYRRGMPPGLDAVRPGEEADCLIPVKFMFRRLAGVLDGVEDDGEDGRCGEATAHNLRLLQRAARLEPDGVLRPELWELLTRLYDLCAVRFAE